MPFSWVCRSIKIASTYSGFGCYLATIWWELVTTTPSGTEPHNISVDPASLNKRMAIVSRLRPKWPANLTFDVIILYFIWTSPAEAISMLMNESIEMACMWITEHASDKRTSGGLVGFRPDHLVSRCHIKGRFGTGFFSNPWPKQAQKAAWKGAGST